MIDTNVVLDWLVFRDPATAALGEAIEVGALTWIATAAMRAELHRVLKPDMAARWSTDRAHTESTWQRWAAEEAAPPTCAWRCTDPDDQMFIDLAVARRATWLLSRDRALLKLGRRALTVGIRVLTPKAWAAAQSPKPKSEAA